MQHQSSPGFFVSAAASDTPCYLTYAGRLVKRKQRKNGVFTCDTAGRLRTCTVAGAPDRFVAITSDVPKQPTALRSTSTYDATTCLSRHGNHLSCTPRHGTRVSLDIWSSGQPTLYLYRDVPGAKNQSFTFVAPTPDKPVKTAKKKRPSVGATAATPKDAAAVRSFRLTSYNCLYTSNVAAKHEAELCSWETEMIARTQCYGKHVVQAKHLYWHTRVKRLIHNMKHGQALPDVCLLQEMTPAMFHDLNHRIDNALSGHQHSREGCCRNYDGYCYVAWNPRRFVQRETALTSVGTLRVVGVLLECRLTQQQYVFVSTHLPASGASVQTNASAIAQALNKRGWGKYPTVLGGDLNNTFPPTLPGYRCLAPPSVGHTWPATFYNDEHAAFDWLVGSRVEALSLSVNPVIKSDGRWPNAKEGSDHTAVRVVVSPRAAPKSSVKASATKQSTATKKATATKKTGSKGKATTKAKKGPAKILGIPVKATPAFDYGPLQDRAVTDAVLTKNAQLMHKLYHPSYRPPDWSLQQLHTLRRTADATVFYHDFDDIRTVRQLVAFREPVNIATKNEGCRLPPWGKTPYQYEKDRDPPNFAIYCKSPIKWKGKPYGTLHLLHSIGYAFDTPRQLDYQHLVDGKAPSAVRTRLLVKYEQIFTLVFACARRKHCHHIALGLVGAGWFAEYYPGGQDAFNRDVWRPALRAVRDKPANHGIQVLILADRDVPTYGASLGFFPTDAVAAARQVAPLEHVLFVNAWDPFSMVGNGNGEDSSLDGWMGRSSASAYLCWPLTNPAIRYETV